MSRPYTYTFSHVTSRDTVVFKSIVGLLTGRTCVNWQYTNSPVADLLVLGNSDEGPYISAENASVVLHLNTGSLNAHELSVNLPLRANDVFKCLEDAAHKLQQHSADTSLHTGDGNACLKLTSWPPQSVLGASPDYLRLAALLGAQAMSCRDLSARSGLSLERCNVFIDQLQALGLLDIQQAQNPIASIAPPTPPGFFARLRAHLGFSSERGNNQ